MPWLCLRRALLLDLLKSWRLGALFCGALTAHKYPSNDAQNRFLGVLMNQHMTLKGSMRAQEIRFTPPAREKLTASAPLNLDSSALWGMERSSSVMSQQVWRWTLPILWLRPQPPLPPPNPSHRRAGCALAKARVGVVGCSRDSPSDPNSLDGLSQYSVRDKQHVMLLGVPWLFLGASVSLRVIRALEASEGTVCQHTKSVLIAN